MRLLGRRELAFATLVAFVVAASVLFSPDRALAALADLGDRPAQFALLLVAVWFVRPFVGWPTVGVSAVAGFVLGPAVGFPVAMVGVLVTSIPPYYAASWFADDGLLAEIGSYGRSYFRTAGDVRGVAAARLAPIPADAISCAAGLAGVGPSAYAAGTLVGELPWTVAAVVVGGSARTLTTDGLGAIGLPLVVATTAAAFVLLAGPVYRVLVDEQSAIPTLSE